MIEILKYILPSLIVGAVAIYFLKSFFKEEQERRFHQMRISSSKESISIRLQAYERLALLLERISMVSLARRIPANSGSTELYQNILIKQINDEFDHNLSQQIYVTPQLWKMIVTAKNATIVAISHTHKTLEEGSDNIDFQRVLITGDSNDDNPTKLALKYLKNEISQEF
ncbi:MAG: hypothetical protein KAH10_02555 [Flavobacteriales bacterium]|nr:hypothetical protein [Flavobacteriales bacterium]